MITQQFPFTFVCEKCGREFYSKIDPSGWRHHVCNGCAGKQYKDYPVDGNVTVAPKPTYQPKPVPTAKPVYNQVQQAPTKTEFNLQEYISDLLMVYVTLRDMCDEAKLTIPQENLCAWATGIMIQKGKATIV